MYLNKKKKKIILERINRFKYLNEQSHILISRSIFLNFENNNIQRLFIKLNNTKTIIKHKRNVCIKDGSKIAIHRKILLNRFNLNNYLRKKKIPNYIVRCW